MTERESQQHRAKFSLRKCARRVGELSQNGWFYNIYIPIHMNTQTNAHTHKTGANPDECMRRDFGGVGLREERRKEGHNARAYIILHPMTHRSRVLYRSKIRPWQEILALYPTLSFRCLTKQSTSCLVPNARIQSVCASASALSRICIYSHIYSNVHSLWIYASSVVSGVLMLGDLNWRAREVVNCLCVPPSTDIRIEFSVIIQSAAERVHTRRTVLFSLHVSDAARAADVCLLRVCTSTCIHTPHTQFCKNNAHPSSPQSVQNARYTRRAPNASDVVVCVMVMYVGRRACCWWACTHKTEQRVPRVATTTHKNTTSFRVGVQMRVLLVLCETRETRSATQNRLTSSWGYCGGTINHQSSIAHWIPNNVRQSKHIINFSWKKFPFIEFQLRFRVLLVHAFSVIYQLDQINIYSVTNCVCASFARSNLSQRRRRQCCCRHIWLNRVRARVFVSLARLCISKLCRGDTRHVETEPSLPQNIESTVCAPSSFKSNIRDN